MKRGFTLVEMLVVMGIIAVLMAVSMMGYSKMTASAERAREQELVSNVATALTALFQDEGSWPKRLAQNGGTDGRLDARTAYALVAGEKKYITLSTSNGELSGYDRFGIVTTWAQQRIKALGTTANLGSKVANMGTVSDHILHYALDLDGDGLIENASVGGASVSVRATAIVWSCGKDGVVSPYSVSGRSSGGRGQNETSSSGRNEDIYSWAPGQTRNVK